MSIFRSKTPNYGSSPGGGNGSAVPSSHFNLCGWLSSLISTPTPSYRSAPPCGSDSPAQNSDPDRSTEVGTEQQRHPCR